ncbi:MAG: Smr/MutS family protein [Odoribacter sp.]|nr:Smr/MutS family protein [Odoribacter sp.]
MTYPQNFEYKIGFDIIRAMVSERCSSGLGAQKVQEMRFESSYDKVARLLGQVAEFVTILSGEDSFPAAVIRDVTGRLKTIRPEGTYLTAAELVDLGATIESMAAISHYFESHRSSDGTSALPLLDELALRLDPYPSLSREINRTVDRWGEIKDTASSELADIRRRITSMGGTAGSVMRRIISKAVADGIIDADTSASVRDGRLVLPVAAMNKRRIPGIVHDESASGKTVFIEPAEVVEVNNRLRELHIEEHREEVRILINVAGMLRPYIDELLESFDLMATFDFIRAKAVFAIDCGGTSPTLVDKPELEWFHACHPVLKHSLESHGKSIVPLDITLTPENRILVISGPNAGGKSVTLKTVAVIQYMLQCGLLPPVYDNSHTGIFANIFIDIGDDQSIEDDLSTYSSHLRNMKYFMNHGNDRTLFLIDEFGAGTEPQIGGAIAQALLADFNDAGMWGVVTTHFQNLKKYAGETKGLVNGSMLYDRQRMSPLFALSIGNPGSSFAIEIARKTGLPEKIISAASDIVGSDYVNLDKYLLDIARDRRYWENKRLQIKQKEKKIEETLERYENEADNLRQRRNEIISEARNEARKILDGSNAAIERTIHDIRRSQAERQATLEARNRLEQDKRNLDAASKEHPLLAASPHRRKKISKTPISQKTDRPLEPGDNVQLDGAGTVGTVEEIRGNQAVVIFGQLRTTAKLDRLKRTIKKASSGASKAASFISVSTADDSRERQLRFKPEIDVRGMRADEALQAVTYFIDDAIQFSSQRVRILHGTGTGALRQCIRQYLSTVPAVTHYADEDVRLGGAGITVVEL